jgi:hypothetical protein
MLSLLTRSMIFKLSSHASFTGFKKEFIEFWLLSSGYGLRERF